MENLRSKLPGVGTTIFTIMSRLAGETGAVNLGQGFPNFPLDPLLGGLVKKYIDLGFNQYAPMQGVNELRKVLSDKINHLYGHRYDWSEEITITAGGTQAIFTAITAIVHPGDEVIAFAPAYDCYAPAVELNGGRVKWIELGYPEYKVDWKHVKEMITSKTRMIIINSPNNPSGTCLSHDDLLMLKTLTDNTDIIVLSDEVYEHIVFDGKTHQSCSSIPELASRSIIVYSFGKTFHNTGWKLGYAVAPAQLMLEFRKIHQFNVFSCNSPVQYALTEYMEDSSKWQSLPQFYQEKRDFFLDHLQGCRFGHQPAEGTYFQLLNYDQLFGEKDTDLAVRLTKEFGIASIPCSVFYPADHTNKDRVLRFCFAKDDKTLTDAATILRSI